MMDLGTKLNMTRTIAPVGVAFNAGIAIGPALGGLMMSKIGMEPTFLAVGSAFLCLGVANHFLIVETAPKLLQGDLNIAINQTWNHWKDLWQSVEMKQLLALNAAFWISSAGGHATILPLILIGPQFNLDVGQTGLVFAALAGVQVLGAPPLAFLCDTWGKEKVLVAGASLLAASMGCVPLLSNGLDPQAVTVFGLWALGTAAFGAAPNSLISDIVRPAQRGQGLSMLRTSNDLGYLLGASLTGYFADQLGAEVALASLSAVLLGNAGLYHRYNRYNRGGGYRRPNVKLEAKLEEIKSRWRKRIQGILGNGGGSSTSQK
ncbi:unnamed protein product [Amoebophrya sp. A25]|nr:unnamed protein product [Amoebophrya sp. A25]|eukprot:GSA25T00008356001.1